MSLKIVCPYCEVATSYPLEDEIGGRVDWVHCPECKGRIEIFSRSWFHDMADKANVIWFRIMCKYDDIKASVLGRLCVYKRK